MPAAPNICVLIPVFNHALTVGRVVRAAQKYFPVLVVNDGSTDDTAKILAAENSVTVLTLAKNSGKGAALRAGFAAAAQMNFTHAITLDADGQHAPEEIPLFAAACRREPHAFVIGVRDLVRENAPRSRRVTNNISTFWFKIETGVALTDTQCGYRCYPLAAISQLRLGTQRYAYELEVMVKAAWAGIPLRAQTVSADYAAPTSRLSHFRPLRDVAVISFLHAHLSVVSFFVPALVRKLSVTGQLAALSFGEKLKTICRLLFAEHADTPGKLSSAVSLGLFCGIAPIWGFQIVTGAALAHKLRLNKAIVLTAAHISTPPGTPLFMAAGLLFGHWLHTGARLPFNATTLLHEIPARLAEWIVGSFALGILVGLVGGMLTWLISSLWLRKNNSSA
ncbi:MAG: hypothetical protein RLZZ350_194 [Verrucomicrobiota bacterium]|jgi:uncharacterized protein (DUF2062 family)